MPTSGNPESTINMEHIAKLARIALSEREKTRFSRELGAILNYFDILKSVNVDGVEPSAHAFPVYNVLRDDTTAPMLDTAALQRIAPAFHDDQVLVPRVVDAES